MSECRKGQQKKQGNYCQRGKKEERNVSNAGDGEESSGINAVVKGRRKKVNGWRG